MERQRLAVTGMSCTGCEEAVENALGALEGVSDVDADHDADTVEFDAESDVDEAAVATAIADAGYEVVETA